MEGWFCNDLFLNVVKSDACNFTDDNTLYSFAKNLENIFTNLKYGLKNVLGWFQANFLMSKSVHSSPFFHGIMVSYAKFFLMAVGDECRSVIFILSFHGGSVAYI